MRYKDIWFGKQMASRQHILYELRYVCIQDRKMDITVERCKYAVLEVPGGEGSDEISISKRPNPVANSGCIDIIATECPFPFPDFGIVTIPLHLANTSSSALERVSERITDPRSASGLLFRKFSAMDSRLKTIDCSEWN